MTFFLRPSRFFFVVMLSSLAALIFASASALVAPPASAIESGDIALQVSPADQRITLEPNQVYDGTFTVENVGRKTFSFTLSSRPYQVSSPDYTPDFSTSNSYTVLSNWLSFSADRTTLAPGESATVTYHVDTPADIPGGGQYAAIIVETRDADDAASVRIASQIAVLLYAQISGEQRLEGTLLDLELPNILLGAPFTASVTVENTGNLDFDLTQTLTVTDFLTGRTLVDLSDNPWKAVQSVGVDPVKAVVGGLKPPQPRRQPSVGFDEARQHWRQKLRKKLNRHTNQEKQCPFDVGHVSPIKKGV